MTLVGKSMVEDGQATDGELMEDASYLLLRLTMTRDHKIARQLGPSVPVITSCWQSAFDLEHIVGNEKTGR